MKDFITYCKDYIIDNLPEHEGRLVYPGDLGYYLTEGPNADGTLTYSSYEAKEYLREWWDEADDYYEYERNNFGTGGHNPFANPEAYMTCMVIEGVNALISQAFDRIEGVDWNKNVELTADLIEQITEEVKENDTYRLF